MHPADQQAELVHQKDDDIANYNLPIEQVLGQPVHPTWKEYSVCRHCGKPVSFGLFAWAMRRFERTIHPDCIRPELLKEKGCCSKAKLRTCNCNVSFECPVHGITCHGSHD